MDTHLECCVCGMYAGKWKQHWNRDTEYGICDSCATEQEEALSAEEMKSLYGIRGVNYGNEGDRKNGQCS